MGEEIRNIRRIFFPYTDDKTKELRTREVARVAYYTTAETAFRILKNREFWMRSTSTMNDFSEVEHGIECLRYALQSASGIFFRERLEAIFPGLMKQAVAEFDSWLPQIRNGTFICCFSEHTPDEDQHGRLSMWRAYGGQAGVALLLYPDVMFDETEGLNVFASPVAYWTRDQIEAELRLIAERVTAESDYVLSLGIEAVRAIIFSMLRFAVVCTKHPGFSEEKEWRTIASPAMFDSPLLQSSLEVLGGVPQVVQKVSLQDYPDLGFAGLEPGRLIDRVLIGPCEYPGVIFSALKELLEKCGVQDAENRIYASGIPLRINSA